ncbi:MAG TPA: hypothetical protein VJT15_00615 [Pyrinomonadaceae bacterium]|nr:hypothetical protein [Pyrinomonadaceae bacterium]
MRSTLRFASIFTLFFCSFALTNSARAQDQPTIAKDSVQVTAFTFNVYKGNYDTWSWVPRMQFRMNGPIASGSQLYVQYSLPTGPWVKFDCDTGNIEKGYWWKTECGGRQIPEDQGSLYTGPVTFTIKMRNELQGTDTTVFTGKMKVAKARSNEHGPKAVNKFVYFVDHDWNLPIGYVYLKADSIHGWKMPSFHLSFWVRGDAYKFDPHLFYQGKEVGKTFLDGTEVGRAGCEAELENNTTHYVEDAVPQKAKWARVKCDFPNIKGRNETGEKPSIFGEMFTLAANPGEYEFKLLWNNKLARSMKFTVAQGGKFDNGIATNNQLGSDVIIVPVQIIGDQDGLWNKTAWQTESFYGNPLKGFTAVP